MTKKEKNKLLRKFLAGFTRPTYREGKEQEKNWLNKLRKDTFFRGRVLFPSELIKPKNEKHREQLNKEMEALGIRVLV